MDRKGNVLYYHSLNYGLSQGYIQVPGSTVTNGSGSNHANVGALAQVPGVIGNHSNGLLPGQIVGGSYLQKYTIPHLTPAQINLLFKQRMDKKKAQTPVECEACGIKLNSDAQAQQHFSGKAHLKRLRKLGLPIPEEYLSKMTARSGKRRYPCICKDLERSQSESGLGKESPDKEASPENCSQKTLPDTGEAAVNQDPEAPPLDPDAPPTKKRRVFYRRRWKPYKCEVCNCGGTEEGENKPKDRDSPGEFPGNPPGESQEMEGSQADNQGKDVDKGNSNEKKDSQIAEKLTNLVNSKGCKTSQGKGGVEGREGDQKEDIVGQRSTESQTTSVEKGLITNTRVEENKTGEVGMKGFTSVKVNGVEVRGLKTAGTVGGEVKGLMRLDGKSMTGLNGVTMQGSAGNCSKSDSGGSNNCLMRTDSCVTWNKEKQGVKQADSGPALRSSVSGGLSREGEPTGNVQRLNSESMTGQKYSDTNVEVKQCAIKWNINYTTDRRGICGEKSTGQTNSTQSGHTVAPLTSQSISVTAPRSVINTGVMAHVTKDKLESMQTKTTGGLTSLRSDGSKGSLNSLQGSKISLNSTQVSSSSHQQTLYSNSNKTQVNKIHTVSTTGALHNNVQPSPTSYKGILQNSPSWYYANYTSPAPTAQYANTLQTAHYASPTSLANYAGTTPGAAHYASPAPLAKYGSPVSPTPYAGPASTHYANPTAAHYASPASPGDQSAVYPSYLTSTLGSPVLLTDQSFAMVPSLDLNANQALAYGGVGAVANSALLSGAFTPNMGVKSSAQTASSPTAYVVPQCFYDSVNSNNSNNKCTRECDIENGDSEGNDFFREFYANSNNDCEGISEGENKNRDSKEIEFCPEFSMNSNNNNSKCTREHDSEGDIEFCREFCANSKNNNHSMRERENKNRDSEEIEFFQEFDMEKGSFFNNKEVGTAVGKTDISQEQSTKALKSESLKTSEEFRDRYSTEQTLDSAAPKVMGLRSKLRKFNKATCNTPKTVDRETWCLHSDKSKLQKLNSNSLCIQGPKTNKLPPGITQNGSSKCLQSPHPFQSSTNVPAGETQCLQPQPLRFLTLSVLFSFPSQDNPVTKVTTMSFSHSDTIAKGLPSSIFCLGDQVSIDTYLCPSHSYCSQWNSSNPNDIHYSSVRRGGKVIVSMATDLWVSDEEDDDMSETEMGEEAAKTTEDDAATGEQTKTEVKEEKPEPEEEGQGEKGEKGEEEEESAEPEIEYVADEIVLDPNDPVAAAFLENMQGKLAFRGKQERPCEVCDLVFNSEKQLEVHLQSERHAKKFLQAGGNPDELPEKLVNTDPDIYCEDCDMEFMSEEQLEMHLAGKKHRSKTTEEISCGVCQMVLNSGKQAEQHFQSDRHKKKVAQNKGHKYRDDDYGRHGKRRRRASDEYNRDFEDELESEELQHTVELASRLMDRITQLHKNIEMNQGPGFPRGPMPPPLIPGLMDTEGPMMGGIDGPFRGGPPRGRGGPFMGPGRGFPGGPRGGFGGPMRGGPGFPGPQRGGNSGGGMGGPGRGGFGGPRGRGTFGTGPRGRGGFSGAQGGGFSSNDGNLEGNEGFESSNETGFRGSKPGFTSSKNFEASRQGFGGSKPGFGGPKDSKFGGGFGGSKNDFGGSKDGNSGGGFKSRGFGEKTTGGGFGNKSGNRFGGSDNSTGNRTSGFGSSKGSGSRWDSTNQTRSFGGSNTGGFGKNQSGGFGQSDGGRTFDSSKTSSGFGRAQSGGFGSSKKEGFGGSKSSRFDSGSFGNSNMGGGFNNMNESSGFRNSKSGGGFGNSQSGMGSGYGDSSLGSGGLFSGGFGGITKSGEYGSSQSTEGFNSGSYLDSYSTNQQSSGFGNQTGGSFGGSQSGSSYGGAQSGGSYGGTLGGGNYGGAQTGGGFNAATTADGNSTGDQSATSGYDAQSGQYNYNTASGGSGTGYGTGTYDQAYYEQYYGNMNYEQAWAAYNQYYGYDNNYRGGYENMYSGNSQQQQQTNTGS